MTPFELLEPTSLKEALGLLDADDPAVRPVGGGTALMLMMKAGVFHPTRLISLRKVGGLSGIAAGVDGSLTIGDTHEYAEPFAFDVEEDAYEHLLTVATRLLGATLPPVRRRWAGVYSQLAGTGLYYRSEVAPGVVLVTGPGGRGMTCAPAIAEQTFG